MIPRIIHQTWKTHTVPSQFEPYCETWRRHNPGWDYRLWSDRDLLEFVAKQYPQHLETFCAYPRNIQRADAGRYMLLHHFGGIYADIDTECLQPLDPLISESRVVLCKEPKAHWVPAEIRGHGFLLFNGVMASPAGHPFWPHLLDRLESNSGSRDVLDSTGPCLLTGAWLAFDRREDVRVDEEHLFNPVDVHGVSAELPDGARCYAMHHWAGTWWKKRAPSWFERKRRSVLKRVHRARVRLTDGSCLEPATALSAVSRTILEQLPPAGDKVAILVPARDAVEHLEPFLAAVSTLELDKSRVKLVFCEGDSKDGTYEKLLALSQPLKERFRDVVVLKKDMGLSIDRKERWRPRLQRRRRAAIAAVRNHLIDHGLDETDDWALWIDADVWRFPANIVAQLLAAKARIVVPNCTVVPGGPSYDLNSFISKPEIRDYRYYRMIRDGLFQPTPDRGAEIRLRLSDLRHSDRVPLNGVGGTMLLVDAALHRGGLRFPEQPYKRLIETEGFGQLARDLGITPIGLPRVEVHHVPW